MTVPQTTATTDPQSIIAALQQRLDAGLAREATLAEELAARDAELGQRNSEYGERRDHQAATIDVLKAMSASPGDPQPVFDLIMRRAVDLCDGTLSALYEYDGTLVHFRGYQGNAPTAATAAVASDYAALFPMTLTRGSIMCRAILDRRTIHITDYQADTNLLPAVKALGHESQLTIPLMREGTAIGAISLNGKRGGFTDSQIELLKTFAEQAVIAISSAETYRALHEALEQQTATAEVLQVINASPGNLTPVFDAMLEKAMRLCEAAIGILFIAEGDVVRVAQSRNVPHGFKDYLEREPPRLDAGSLLSRAMREKAVLNVADLRETAPFRERVSLSVAAVELGGIRSICWVPLVHQTKALGLFAIFRQEVKPFSGKQVTLLENFAAQAVIAMENARLLTEQREALDQQTATSDVLQVINASPGNLAPVFDAVLEKAMRLCGAAFGSLYTYDGERFHSAAHRGVPPAFAAFRTENPPLPTSGGGPATLLETRRPFQVLDLRAHETNRPDYPGVQAMVELGGIRTILMVPLLKDEAFLGYISIFRQEVRAFADKQIALLENFAAQAVIAMENVRLLSEQREALEQQTATAEVLQVINASPGNLVPVFDAILEKAMRLCGVAFGMLNTWDGEQLHSVATRGLPSGLAEWDVNNQTHGAGPLALKVFQTKRSQQLLDMRDSEGYQAGFGGSRALADLGGARTLLLVPLVKDDSVVGYFQVFRQEVRAFSDKEIGLLENFAAQAIIAMENARLLTEQREALEQQTATAEVLQVINASPGNLTPVFEAILEKAHDLCDIAYGDLQLYDGEHLHSVAQRGLSSEFADRLRQGYRASDSPASRPLLAGGRFTHITDAAAVDFMVFRSAVRLDGIRTVLFVPLRKDGSLLGMITSARREVRPFTEKEISLLENFAAQAVIAMENARLINEQREALEQQTATAEVLQVINASPGNLTPVFDAMLEKAMRLCGAACGGLFTYDGERFHTMATLGVPVAAAEFRTRYPPTAQPGSGIARLLKTRRTDQILDRMAEEDYRSLEPGARAMVELGGARTMLNVPLLKEDEVVGFFSVYRQEVRAFSEKQIALLENFAAQAVIAMENARLLDEIRQRQDELRITFENMGDGVAMFDETQHLVAWNRKFQDILDVPDEVIARRQTFHEYVRYLADRGEYGAGTDAAENVRGLIEQAGQSRTYERTRPDGRVIEIRHNPVAGGGFVLIYADITERKRNEAEIRTARDAAEEASRTIETAFRELKAAQANLIQAEKMASLGQLTAGIAHEIKNPLNFVNNFAALSVDLLRELKETAAPGFAALTDDQRGDIDDVSAMLTSNLEKITEHGKRADGIVKAMLEHSRGSSAERRMVDLNVLIDEALNLAYHGARAQDQSFNITLERDFGAGIAPIEVNPQDITRVLLNIFSNGFYAATRRARNGGEAGFMPMLKVTTRDTGETAVEIRVRDNGAGIPVAIRDKLFQPFFTTKPTGEGTGLGLSITYDIITKQHGGTITVDSEVDVFTEFVVTLPRQMFTNDGGRA